MGLKCNQLYSRSGSNSSSMLCAADTTSLHTTSNHIIQVAEEAQLFQNVSPC